MSSQHAAKELSETVGAPTHGPDPLSTAGSFANGKILGKKYRIDFRLAEGGNGVVVAATHVALEQPVAIKHLKPGPASDAEIVERFEREGRLAAKLTSDHVVRVLDVGDTPNSGPYMVMERLAGRDLAQVLRETGPLPISLAVDYVLQACDGLANAHALRIVHRDIKPDNLFLAEQLSKPSIVKIIDFGISKTSPEAQNKWARETSQNVRMGSPAYMSPEQLRSSADVDARTDIWSLGVTLFELLTGKLPFQGDDLPQLCTAILHSSPAPLRDIRSDAPEELEGVIFKCLAKEPAERFGNIGELAAGLAPFGPPSAMERSDRIKDLIGSSGTNSRLGTPIASFDPIAIPAELRESRIVRPSGGKRAILAAASVVAIGGGVGLVALGSGIKRGDTQAAGSNATSVAGAPSAAALAAPAPAVAATTSIVAGASSSEDMSGFYPTVDIKDLPKVHNEHVQKTMPPRVPAAKKSAPVTSRAPATAPTSEPAPPAATTRPDPRALFGERQ